MKPLYVSKWRVDETENLIGARGKSLLIDKVGKRYFFKLPKSDRMRFELWSEIIASRYGQKLGLNVVSYHLAVYNSELGVLCPSFQNDKIKLIHGFELLKNYISDSEFSVDNNPICSFQDIVSIFRTLNRMD